MLMAKLHI